ncbi:DivIVA domain-containing protein [Solwaraspora sp. WMMB335]|uniref:DivIVA domain-containing protein n=1 Tax=Solwaraspora sp. WMMB335 TaxID=3404118 RepID=UPI003B95E5AD
MRNLLHRIVNRPSRRLHRIVEPPHPAESRRPRNSGVFRLPPLRPRMSPDEVREHQFRTVRRGLDPAEVYAFLHRVAEDVSGLRDELRRTHDENDRIKYALREWQSEHMVRRYAS